MSRLSGNVGHGAVRPSEMILADLASDTTRGHLLHQKLTVNRDRNWLLALALHGFGKLRSGRPLSDAEDAIVGAFRDSGLGEARLKEHGRLYGDLDAGVRRKFFPDPVAELAADAEVTFDDIAEWLTDIDRALASQPNVRALDPQPFRKGTHTLSDQRGLPTDVLAHYASAITLATGSDGFSPPSMKCLVKAERFKCNVETGWQMSGADAPYWVFGAVDSDGRHPVGSLSRVFDDVDTGEIWKLSPTEGRIWGPSGIARELPPTLALIVSLWQHVGGSREEVEAATDGAVAAAAHFMAAMKSGPAPVAVSAGAAALLVWLLTFLNEDYIGDHVLLLDRDVLEGVLTSPDDELPVEVAFSDGDGDYTLEVSVRRSPWRPGG